MPNTIIYREISCHYAFHPINLESILPFIRNLDKLNNPEDKVILKHATYGAAISRAIDELISNLPFWQLSAHIFVYASHVQQSTAAYDTFISNDESSSECFLPTFVFQLQSVEFQTTLKLTP